MGFLEIERRQAYLRDLFDPRAGDPGAARVADECAAWIGRAQTAEGGVARSYAIGRGWEPPYPEVTGYIVPTLLDCARLRGDRDAGRRARRMLDWLAGAQLESGAFQGGTVEDRPRVAVAFNTGQVLLGLAAGVRELGVHRSAMIRAGDWLVRAVDPDGAMRRYGSPFLSRSHPTLGPHAYATHVAWALFEAARLEPDRGYAEAAAAITRFASTLVRENGFVDRSCLDDAERPLTHTIGYTLRGFVEAHRFTGDAHFLEVSRRIGGALLGVLDPRDGFLPGRVDASLRPAASWACLTGSAQIAIAWHRLHEVTGRSAYRDAALAALAYVRRTIKIDGAPETRGGVRGSFPVSGGYARYRYPSWAAKFVIDACLLELGAHLDPNADGIR